MLELVDMNILTLPQLLLAGLLTGSVLTIGTLWRRVRALREDIERLGNELHILLTCERGMSERMKTQQMRLHEICDRQDQIELCGPESGHYRQAATLLQRGAQPDELLDACELSRGELDLIAHLQKARAAH